MIVRDMRIRYELKSASGKPVVNAVVCCFDTLKPWADKIRETGYRIVGIDERFHEHSERPELDEGWLEVKPATKGVS